MHFRRLALGLLLLCSALASAQQLAISQPFLTEALQGELYYQELRVTSGNPPYNWSVVGKLPAGISLDSATGTLTGIPTSAGDYRFTITVRDSGQYTVNRGYVLRVRESTAIAIIWTRPPVVADGGISGEVEVSNPGREAF